MVRLSVLPGSNLKENSSVADSSLFALQMFFIGYACNDDDIPGFIIDFSSLSLALFLEVLSRPSELRSTHFDFT